MRFFTDPKEENVMAARTAGGARYASRADPTTDRRFRAR
jgi:hypothetical protein